MNEFIIRSSVSRKNLEEYFKSISNTNLNNTQFFGDGWQVDISETSFHKLGIINIKHIKVVFKAEEKKLLELVKNFRLTFLTAGG
ncbi:MAG: hypothetical protein ACTSWX_13050 [Promethearchaeota archaeon]